MGKEGTKERKHTFLLEKLLQNVKMGDRVIWMIVVILVLMSLACIFSSTSLLAMKSGVDRTDILIGHLMVVGAGIAIMVLLSTISNIRFFRVISQWCFPFSLVMLLALVLRIRIGNLIYVPVINGARRAITIFGFNLQVYEVVKVAMVMYLAWAVQTYESGKFVIANKIATSNPGLFGWLKSQWGQKWVFIFLPILITTALILVGSTGSALLCAITMFATIWIAGMKWWKDLLLFIFVSLLLAGGIVELHYATDHKFIPRLETAINRFTRKSEKVDFASLKRGSQEFYDYLDQVRQPEAAKIAIVEGGRRIIGKTPGKSTQKYIVAVMFEDYMFSFIVEEYGLFMGFIIIFMYMSLFARGVIIAHNCNNRYAKACVGGLVFLITGQALFHIFINCNIGPTSGQTLPLISHGRCSFLCVSIALGVILSISKMANKKIKVMQVQLRAQEKAIETNDDVESAMSCVEQIDDMLELNEMDNLEEPGDSGQEKEDII